jgi:hypothetical protein
LCICHAFAPSKWTYFKYNKERKGKERIGLLIQQPEEALIISSHVAQPHNSCFYCTIKKGT